MEPLISVIIPVYNGEKYIESVKNSLENQLFQNFEVIFINDGSTDNSQEILESIESQNNHRYRVISQKNKGVSAARNAGIYASRGKYITFVDVDDLLHPLFLKKMLETIVSDNMICITNFGNIITNIDENKINLISRTRVKSLEDFLYGKIHIGVCGLVIAKALLIKYNLFFKEGYKYSEDLHMVWRIFCHVDNVVLIDAPLYIYKMTQGSAMTKINKSRFDSIELISSLKDYIKKECPEFYPQFSTFAVPRMAWSLLWQAAHYLHYEEFLKFVKQYDFKSDMKKLLLFPVLKVRLSAIVFLFSRFIYYVLVHLASFKYRRKT